MAYLGGFSLRELASLAGLELDLLTDWRTRPDFLAVMDWSKARFSHYYQEDILLTDYSPQEYREIAGEFVCLEDSIRVRVRAGLYPRLDAAGTRLSGQYHHGLPLDTSLFPRFHRLFGFFWALEALQASPARPHLQDRLLPLAREVVWPALGLSDEEEWSGETGEDVQLAEGLKEALAGEIRKLFT